MCIHDFLTRIYLDKEINHYVFVVQNIKNILDPEDSMVAKVGSVFSQIKKPTSQVVRKSYVVQTFDSLHFLDRNRHHCYLYVFLSCSICAVVKLHFINI